MAGLGFKDFQVGEVLTSSDVDGYLMQQTVMRFADAAARGSALGTATGTAVALAEGMVTYLDDLNELEVFDGTVWSAVTPPPAVVAVKRVGLTGTFSTTSTSYTDITGLTITYTPTDTANKILLSTSVLFDHSVVGQFIDLRHYDGSSQIDQMWRMVPQATTQRYMVTLQNEYTAASTSSTTYASQVLINNTGTLNIYNGSMTLIEYAP